MPMIGTIGKPLIIRDEPRFAIKNVALIKFGESNITNTYIQALLSSAFFDEVIVNKGKGITQKFLSLGDMRDLDIPLPPLALQNRFADFVRQADKSKVVDNSSRLISGGLRHAA
jgi:type I restriction enzyme S subunit